MAIITQEITVEVAKPNYFQALVAKQGDINSRFLKVTFAHNGEKIEIKSTSTAMIGGERPDGQSKTFAGEVNADGTATVPLVGWMLELTGLLKCDVTIVDVDGRKLSSTSFKVMVDEAACSDDDITTDDNYDILTSLAKALEGGEEIIKACEEATTAATEATQLASSHPNNRENPHGVTVTQIGAAPAGYGLGEVPVEVSLAELDNIYQNGWYRVIVSGNVGGYRTEYADVRVDAWGTGAVTQTLNPHSTHGSLLVRQKDGSGWHEWEWVNPPMHLGAEFRTTQRWMGKAVYKKLIDFGTLPNTTSKSIYVGIASEQVIKIEMRSANNNEAFCEIGGHAYNGTIFIYDNRLQIRTTSDLSTFNAYITVWYIKD